MIWRIFYCIWLCFLLCFDRYFDIFIWFLFSFCLFFIGFLLVRITLFYGCLDIDFCVDVLLEGCVCVYGLWNKCWGIDISPPWPLGDGGLFFYVNHPPVPWMWYSTIFSHSVGPSAIKYFCFTHHIVFKTTWTVFEKPMISYWKTDDSVSVNLL